MKFVCLSDTHSKHREVNLPEGDALLHAGDFTSMGHLTETIDFLKWFESQPHKHKVFISGNHDFFDQEDSSLFKELLKEHAPSCTYLRDEGIEIEGIKIWGRPWTPTFFDWAFMLDRESPKMRSSLEIIPKDTDILLTHGPAYGILDEVQTMPLCRSVGCKDTRAILDNLNLSFYVCGHIHFSSGVEKVGETTYINCAVLGEDYKLAKEPVCFEFIKS